MTATEQLLWPRADGPDDLAAIEQVPLAQRGLPATTHDLLRRAATCWPDRPAVTFLPDAERWQQPSTRTFARLLDDVERAASALRALRVGRQTPVALVSVNCEQMLTALLAAEVAGIAAPINPALRFEHAHPLLRRLNTPVIVAAGPELDPDAWELGRRLAAATPSAVLLALRPTAASGPPPQLEPVHDAFVAWFEKAVEDADAAPAALPPAAAEDLASCLHTGGTTGTPKLAARTHRNEITNAWMVAAATSLDADSSAFAALPLFHTNALVVTVLAALLRGQHVVWAGPLGYRDIPLYGVFWRLVERYRIGAMSAVPTVYAVLGQVPVDADISSLRYPVVGAAPLPPAVTEAFRDRTGLDLCEGYGLTEGTCASARNWPGAIRPGSVGQRMPYQQIRAIEIDETTGRWRFLPDGEIGTLVIRGPNVFAGYLTDSRDGLVADPGEKVRDGWLDTGDRGSVAADGYVTLAGRVKDLIIRGGHNIDPAAIEDVLLDHPAVTAAAAVGRPDPHAGEVPIAYVQLADGASVTTDELRAWAATRVPEPAAVPKQVEIVDAIPLTIVGKPFKPELRRRAAEDAARDALRGRTDDVHAHLHDGEVVVETSGISERDAHEALSPYSIRWRLR
ncbi:acyl-CoA synthetase [Conexibacter stalactiti]|uniref:Acyl-CoA synthetase n=1 Tax=Conexibacter stalactiti TaxID=1940611 RepID=A0ABU4HIK7_9ACTN|nr:acyl-CoA synthetase [Conexibacter stalactiti]MDW5593085.1 acyl-CoA synthetase [Conexibacter stalactiti]MEC5033726.1 acyl-CoA synthetase [Conexibacter stalactiti]